MITEIRLPADVQLPAVIILKAGELSCMYEMGKLRYIRRGETELIRMIYGAVRDGHWATLPYKIEDEQVTANKDCFFIQFTAVYLQQAAVYKAGFTIEGKVDNSIVFSMKGIALAAFQKNRIGICIHHPVISCGGRGVQVTQPNGNIYQSVFPEMVSPRQPLLQIQEMQWQTDDKTVIRLQLEGDVFETEDQRNWSDSSYKTYGTPLHIPFPVSLQAGNAMQQRVTVTAISNAGIAVPAIENKREEKIPFPKIGYARPVETLPLAAIEASWFKKIPFHHYRTMLVMEEENWVNELQTVFEEAARLATRLELVVVFPDKFLAALNRLLPLLKAQQALLYSLLLLQKNTVVSPEGLLEAAYPLIKKILPAILVGYGTDLSFVELNRQRPVGKNFDFVCYSLHPQAHMTDTRSILENLDNQPDMIATAKDFAGKPVHISPVTLKDRYDNAGPDSRQHTALAAWFTLIAIQQLAMAGSITLYDLYGEAGLLRVERNNHHEMVGIRPAAVYEILAAIHAFQPVYIIKRYAGQAVKTDGLLLENAQGERLFFKGPEEWTSCRNC